VVLTYCSAARAVLGRTKVAGAIDIIDAIYENDEARGHRAESITGSFWGKIAESIKANVIAPIDQGIGRRSGKQQLNEKRRGSYGFTGYVNFVP